MNPLPWRKSWKFSKISTDTDNHQRTNMSKFQLNIPRSEGKDYSHDQKNWPQIVNDGRRPEPIPTIQYYSHHMQNTPFWERKNNFQRFPMNLRKSINIRWPSLSVVDPVCRQELIEDQTNSSCFVRLSDSRTCLLNRYICITSMRIGCKVSILPLSWPENYTRMPQSQQSG